MKNFIATCLWIALACVIGCAAALRPQSPSDTHTPITFHHATHCILTFDDGTAYDVIPASACKVDENATMKPIVPR